MLRDPNVILRRIACEPYAAGPLPGLPWSVAEQSGTRHSLVDVFERATFGWFGEKPLSAWTVIHPYCVSSLRTSSRSLKLAAPTMCGPRLCLHLTVSLCEADEEALSAGPSDVSVLRQRRIQSQRPELGAVIERTSDVTGLAIGSELGLREQGNVRPPPEPTVDGSEVNCGHTENGGLFRASRSRERSAVRTAAEPILR